MESEWYCPWCKTLRVIEIEKTLFCPACQIKFTKKLVRIINEDIKKDKKLNFAE